MKYASTLIYQGIETVVTVLPLSMVPGFDPASPPQENTYGVSDDVDVGWIKVGGVFIAPSNQPAPIPRSSTSLQFMDRFTEAEQDAIISATMTSVQVKKWYDRMIAATEIIYKDPRTLGGLQALVDSGLLTAARMDEILPVAWR